LKIKFSVKYYAVILAVSLSACISTYQQKLASIKSEVKSSNYKNAVNLFNKTGLHKQKKNSLLYNLEAGLLYHLAGEYKTSNNYLENAEWVSDELYTKSISQEAATLLTSNKILPYRGEYYEYLFTNYYKLLNYLYLGNLEDALVEVRRINHKLSLFKKDDAFMHYLTAILYQHNRQYSDAFIEYKKAYNAYKKYYPKNYDIKFPKQLSKDIAVFCKESKFPRCNEFPDNIRNGYTSPSNYGSVVFIVETGFVPHKYEERVEATLPQKYKKENPDKFKDVYYLTVALPQYGPDTDNVSDISLNLNGNISRMDIVEDLGKMARKTLQEDKPKIIAKAIARAVAKYIAYNKAKAKGEESSSTLGRVLGTTVNIFGAATEGADTRSWLTLPNKIFFSKQYLKPGNYSFKLNINNSTNDKKQTVEDNITIKSGEVKFVVLRQF
jgi:hypothetical protein